jgi:hypothetical protein
MSDVCFELTSPMVKEAKRTVGIGDMVKVNFFYPDASPETLLLHFIENSGSDGLPIGSSIKTNPNQLTLKHEEIICPSLTPLAMALIGRAIGDIVTIGNTGTQATVLSIEKSSLQLREP